MNRRVPLGLAIVVVLSFACAVESGAQAPPEEGASVAVLPAPTPHWVFLYQLSSLGSFTPSSVTIIDADSSKMLGMLTGGLGSAFAIAPDHSTYYMADTFFSRGARGERTDV